MTNTSTVDFSGSPDFSGSAASSEGAAAAADRASGPGIDNAGTEAPRAIGRPRSTRAHEAIIDAVLDLLAEGTSVGELSIEAVAARAGVGKATIYRRWSGKNDLILEAVKALKAPQSIDEGLSVRDNLVQLLSVVSVSVDPRAARVFPCIVPEVLRNPELWGLYQQIVEPRRARTREVLERGISTGELRADTDVEMVALMLTGPVMLQRMLRWSPSIDDATLPERVVDTLLRGIAVPQN
ncbi:AcrR family transcriptional regulator [Hamadaea flava]|uniref:TetR/AcrR family transcriptional regulator n=1 Tax=Hamadaea flava TaxID=1742688 RepID=A0ABV8LPL0_9ACTN|nr:TetR/AcrR family transcriptional regulator [Hamadaea flava]MCP2322428.1 AcrR family transcriptional regulator [Hamadaea flava]